MCPDTSATIVSLICPTATVEGALGFWRSKRFICHSWSRMTESQVLLTHQQPTAIFDFLTLALAKGHVVYWCAFVLQGARLVLLCLCPLLRRPKSVSQMGSALCFFVCLHLLCVFLLSRIFVFVFRLPISCPD